MHLEIEFPDIEDFYREAMIVEPYGHAEHHADQKNNDRIDFRGLSNKDILKYKYGYTPGVEHIEELDASFVLGSSRFKYKWNEEDGDEMSMERAYNDLPYLKQRRRTIGNNSGKFITIHVNTGELGWVEADEMLCKCYTVATLVNKLETMGYRTRILMHTFTRGVGYLNGQSVDTMEVKCPLKQFEEPLNLPLIIYCISPWFHRYWMFLLRAAKLKVSGGMGSSARIRKKDTQTDIYIDTGQCLDEDDAKERLEQISKTLTKGVES